MFTNMDGCTFYRKSVQGRMAVFTRAVTGAAYCERTASQADGTNRAPENRTLIIIHRDNIDFEPKPGDRVVCGVTADENCPPNALTVMTVKDFRYGSGRVQHWEVVAE